MLLEGGADPNIVAPDGETPLHRAARKGFIDVVKLLLDNGANPFARYFNKKASEITENDSIKALLIAKERSLLN
jgi:ankyrin repeat protein